MKSANCVREDFNKKNSKKSDIVTIRSGTYLPYLNSDIEFSDICSKTSFLPTQENSDVISPKLPHLKPYFVQN